MTRKCKGELWVEKPDVLSRRLANHASGLLGNLLPNPAESLTQYMCSAFFLSVLRRSRSWAYPWTNKSNKKFYSPPGERSKSVCALTNNPGPKIYPYKTNDKTASVLNWMKEQAELHCMLPNAEGTVLHK